MLNGKWENSTIYSRMNYNCGFCGILVSPKGGYNCSQNKYATAKILICPNCNEPTYYNFLRKEYYPSASTVETVKNLPSELEELYKEIKQCLSVSAYTATVMLCRKMLMNISVREGAAKNLSFIEYVSFLEEEHYITPHMKPWVDKIRKTGNEGNHEITSSTVEETLTVVEFLSMLLKIIYEYPIKAGIKEL